MNVNELQKLVEKNVEQKGGKKKDFCDKSVRNFMIYSDEYNPNGISE